MSTMTDSEMLELAAKAAGYDVEIDYYGPGHHGKKSADIGAGPAIWNPLTSDGDALRMAVGLGIKIGRIGDRVYASWAYAFRVTQCDEYFSDDPYAAARLAITRAAAEIGRSVE